jgi:hypothetical protein
MRRTLSLAVFLVLTSLVLFASCTGNNQRKQLTLAVVSGVEGEALKQAVAVRVIEGFSSEIGSAPMYGLTMH